MKKKSIICITLVLVLMLALFAFTACDDAETIAGVELLTNGEFTNFNDSKFDSWTTSPSANYKKSTYSDDSTNNYLVITNDSEGYSYLKQTFAVENKKYYKITVDVKLTADLSGAGAYVSFLENTDYKFVIQNTLTNGWKTCTFYVQPKNTDYLTLALCLGSENEGTTGKVYFDNISVSRIEKDNIPDSSQIIVFKKSTTINSDSNSAGITFVVLLSLLSIALFIVAYYLIKRLYSKEYAFNNINYKNSNTKIESIIKNPIGISVFLVLLTFLMRLIILLSVSGEGIVMTNIITNAKNIFSNGINNVDYSSILDTNINLGGIYILAILGAIGQNANTYTLSILFRFINILADIAVVLIIYFYGRKYVGDRSALIYSIAFSLLPIVYIISGIQASFTSLLIAMLMGSLILAIEKKYLPTYALMTLTCVLDVRALALAPIIVTYFVYMYIKDSKDLKKFTSNRAMIVFGLVASFVLAYLITLPFGINQISSGDAFYNFKLIVGEVSNINVYTVNALNLYGMVGMNNKLLTDGVAILNLIFILVLEAYVISLYFKNKNKQELVLLTSFVFAMISVFTLKISYNYLIISIIFGILYTMISGDKRMYFVTAGYSVLSVIGIGQLYNQSGLFIPDNSNVSLLNFETTSPFYIVFCVFTVLLSIYYVYVTYSITNDTKIVDIKPLNQSIKTIIKNKLHK